MRKYISLLRGINVGGKTLKMDMLRGIYESLNLQDIKSYIQSGNILFNTKEKNIGKLRTKLEKEIKSQTGLIVSIIFRNRKELKDILDTNPFMKTHDSETAKMYVTLLEKEPSKELVKNLIPSKRTEDEFKKLNREIYLFCGNGYGRTVLTNDFFEKKLKLKATTRNWRTLNKLYELSSD